tara:strand:+ start:1412 stop:2470 length:1059 start_codon:yes stop_codon:yes gene_type:complete
MHGNDPSRKDSLDIFGWDHKIDPLSKKPITFDSEHVGFGLEMDKLPGVPSTVYRKLKICSITVIVTRSDTEVKTYAFAEKTEWTTANAEDTNFHDTAKKNGTPALKNALSYFFKEEDGVVKVRWATVEWQQEWRRFIYDTVKLMRQGHVFIGFNAKSDLDYIEKSMPTMQESDDAGEGWGPGSYDPNRFVQRMREHTFCVQNALKNAFQALNIKFARGEQTLKFWCACNHIGSKYDNITGAHAITLACQEDWRTLATYCAEDAKLHFLLFERATSDDGVVHPNFGGGKRSVTVGCDQLTKSLAEKYEAYVKYVKQNELNDNSRAAGGAAPVGEKRKEPEPTTRNNLVDLTGE